MNDYMQETPLILVMRLTIPLVVEFLHVLLVIIGKLRESHLVYLLDKQIILQERMVKGLLIIKIPLLEEDIKQD